MVVVFERVIGQHLDAHEEFKTRLAGRVHVRQDNILTVCDIILAFCTITSRVGTDVEAAMREIPEGKPVILVVFHHTFDPDYVVPDSRRFINRQNVLLVDILFHETQGLLRCLHNDEALKEVTDHLIVLGAENLPPPATPRDSRIWVSALAVVGTIVFVVVILGILKGTNVI